MGTSRSVLERVLDSAFADLPAEPAKRLLKLRFETEDKDRYLQLSEKTTAGALTDEERLELDELLTANDLLIIVQSKAGASLRRLSVE